jgi:hypothetical protein
MKDSDRRAFKTAGAILIRKSPKCRRRDLSGADLQTTVEA